MTKLAAPPTTNSAAMPANANTSPLVSPGNSRAKLSIPFTMAVRPLTALIAIGSTSVTQLRAKHHAIWHAAQSSCLRARVLPGLVELIDVHRVGVRRRLHGNLIALLEHASHEPGATAVA